MVTPHRFVLHIDGKHKLHHGKWMLVSIGTHDLRFDEATKQLSHSYRPLVYMFVKQQETTESVKMLCEALDLMAYTRYGVFLKPGTVNMERPQQWLSARGVGRMAGHRHVLDGAYHTHITTYHTYIRYIL